MSDRMAGGTYDRHELTDREVRIVVQTRAFGLETSVFVYGNRTPEEAVRIVRETLRDGHGLRVEYVDPAVEG